MSCNHIPNANYKLAFASPYDSGSAGFCLPIYTDGDGQTFIPILDEFTGQICDMARYAMGPEEPICLEGPIVSLPFEPFWVFQNPKTGVRWGQSREISSYLISEFEICSLPVQAQIAEIVDLAEDQQRSLRRSMIDAVGRAAGAPSAQSYETDMVRTRVWDLVVRRSIDREAAELALRHRRQLVIAKRDGTWRIDGTPEVLAACGLTDTGQLERLIHDEFGTLSAEAPQNDHYEALHSYRSDQLQQIIASSPRQEERVALVLQALIEDLEVGKSVAYDYKDRAQFANSIMDAIRDNLPYINEHNSAESFAAHLVGLMFTRAYPMRRGQLLEDLASKLGKFPAVNRAIHQKMLESSSMFVRNHENRILQKLAM